eukprot:30937-Pelagococcus_subviridis.AAC.13
MSVSSFRDVDWGSPPSSFSTPAVPLPAGSSSSINSMMSGGRLPDGGGGGTSTDERAGMSAPSRRSSRGFRGGCLSLSGKTPRIARNKFIRTAAAAAPRGADSAAVSSATRSSPWSARAVAATIAEGGSNCFAMACAAVKNALLRDAAVLLHSHGDPDGNDASTSSARITASRASAALGSS